MKDARKIELTENEMEIFISAKQIVCKYCEKATSYTERNCNDCQIYNLEKDFHLMEEHMIENMNTLEGLDPVDDSFWYSGHPLYKKCGIYGIYVKDKLVYVGRSTNIIQRWISHTKSTTTKTKESNKKIYVYLNKKYKENINIEFKVIELCDEESLREKEDYWINKYLPALNQVIPSTYGYKIKKVQTI